MRISNCGVLRATRTTVAALLLIVLFLTNVVEVQAIAQPTTLPQINDVYVYKDCSETGDIGVLIDYYLDYTAPYPSETATDSFLAIFIDANGATQLKAVAPYTFQFSGYKRGLVWIYFTAAEATAYGLDVSKQALYEIWLVGNPTLTWTPDPTPPKTTAGIGYWQTTGDTSVLLALRVLSYANILELAWGGAATLLQTTPLGNRLATDGDAYFTNVITGLRTMAPGAFASTEISPIIERIDYTTGFGAVMTNGTGNVTDNVGAPAPITSFLSGGVVNTVNVTVAGTFFFELSKGTTGNVSNGTGTMPASPVKLVAGTNNITVTGVGTLVVRLKLVDTVTKIEDTILGTGWDLTEAATKFGMSRLMFSGLVWMLITVVICAAVFGMGERQGVYGGGGGGAGKIVLLVFDICIIGGAVLGLLHPIVATLMFIGFGAFTGYVLFFRGANV